MPSTDVTFSGVAGAAAGAAFFGAAAGLAACVVASMVPAVRVRITASRPSPPFFQRRI